MYNKDYYKFIGYKNTLWFDATRRRNKKKFTTLFLPKSPKTTDGKRADVPRKTSIDSTILKSVNHKSTHETVEDRVSTTHTTCKAKSNSENGLKNTILTLANNRKWRVRCLVTFNWMTREFAKHNRCNRWSIEKATGNKFKLEISNIPHYIRLWRNPGETRGMTNSHKQS